MSGFTPVTVSDTPHENFERRLRRAAEELDRRIRCGSEARAEEYFARDPQLAGNETAALDLIYAEVFAREARGEKPTCTEFIERFPQWAVALQQQFAIHEILALGMEDAAPPKHVTATPDPDWFLGDYEIVEMTGQGATSVVYRAVHRTLGRTVAIKMQLGADRSSPQWKKRLEAEAAAIARLQHPQIVKLYELGFTPAGTPYLVLEWMDHGSLADRIQQDFPKSRWSAEVLQMVARAADAVHQCGIIHRDLTPSNILLDERDAPRITDFGLAKWLKSSPHSTRSGEFHGTPCYAAPEQIHSPDKIDPRTDVYALGGILYTLLTGYTPFMGETPMEMLHSVLTSDPVPPERLRPQVSRDLSTICLKCLQKEPSLRYASAAELADDLGRYLNGEPIRARRAGWGERAWKWMRRNPTAAALLIPAVLALLFGSISYTVSLRRANESLEIQRKNAVQRQQLVAKQLDTTQQTLYAMQLAQASSLWMVDPGRTLDLLQDPVRCPAQLREFTWQLLEGLCRPETASHSAHTDSVIKTLFSPGGEWILSGSVDGTVRCWSWQGEPLPESRLLAAYPGRIRDLAVSPDGSGVAVAHDGLQEPIILSLPDGTLRRRFGEHRRKLTSVAFSPDGGQLVSVDEDAVCLWDVNTGSLLLKLDQFQCCDAAFSGDGSQLLLAGPSMPLVYWDIDRNREVRRVPDSFGGRTLVVSRDHSLLAVLREFEGMEALRANEDGRITGLGNKERLHGMVDVLRLNEGERITRLATPGVGVHTAAFSSNGRTLLTGGSDKMIHEWDLETGRELSATAAHADNIRGMDIHPSERFCVTGSGDCTVKIWDCDSYRDDPAAIFPDVRRPLSVALSPDRNHIAVGGEDRAIWVGAWDDLTHWRRLAKQDADVNDLLFSADGQRLIAGDASGEVKIWDLPHGTLQRTLSTTASSTSGRVMAMTLSPDGETLMVARLNGGLQFWNLADGSAEDMLLETNIWSLELSPEGRLLTLGTDLGDIWLLDLQTRTRTFAAQMEGNRLSYPASSILDLAYSPDGRWCAAGTRAGLVTLWDARKWIPVHQLRGHSTAVQSLAFSVDGRTLVSGTGSTLEAAPGEVKLWDLQSGHNLATFHKFGGPVMISPEGVRLLTSGYNAGLFLFNGSRFRDLIELSQPFGQ